MAGIMSILGHAPQGAVRIPGGETGGRKFGRTYARYNGAQPRKTEYFARGGRADPEDEAPEVPPELKLAAYELLEALDSSRYSSPDGKSGRAEAFACALLAFVRLADEMPHEEGKHEGEAAEGGEGKHEGEAAEGGEGSEDELGEE